MQLNIPEFDAKKHAYRINGRPAPGTTTIITSVVGENPFWTPAGREAGKATHTAIYYEAQNDLNYASLAEETKPRLEAYQKFCLDMGFKPTLLEQPLYHPTLLYCGTPDQAEIDRCVADFKNGPHLPQHALQLAAYAFMLPNPWRYERWGVHLRADGKYDIQPYPKQTITSDFNIFQSCLNTFNWRRRCLPQSLPQAA